MIEISNEQIERVNIIMRNIRNGSNRVFTNAINRALLTVRSESGREIREVYNIKQSDITSNQNMRMKRAGYNDLAGEIAFAGTVIPLIKFRVSPSRPERRMVSVAVLRDAGGKRLKSAYVADLGLYGVGVFERMTRKRESSMQLFGPSAAQMMGNENVLDKVADKAQRTLDTTIDHEMNRILRGYGG